MSNRLTIHEWAQSSGSPEVIAVSNDLVAHGSIFARDIPFIRSQNLSVSGRRFLDLPAITWRNLNENPGGEIKTPTPYTEQAYIWSALVESDLEFEGDQSLVTNPHADQISLHLEAFSRSFNNTFINNHHNKNGDPKAPVGIRERLDDPTKYGVATGQKIDASGVDLTFAGTGTAVEWAKFTEILHKALAKVGSPTGDGCVIYVADDFFLRLYSKLQQFTGVGGYSTKQDNWGRTVTKFQGARIEPVGYKLDQITPIITTTETAIGADGSSNFTSIYVVNYNDGNASGWTKTPLGARNVPDGDKGILRKTLMQWSGGLIFHSTRSISRIYNIKVS